MSLKKLCYLLEGYPTPTPVLMATTAGKVRLAAKWAEFSSLGTIPGSNISDGIYLGEKNAGKIKNKIKETEGSAHTSIDRWLRGALPSWIRRLD